MSAEKKVKRLAEIGKEEGVLMRRLAKLQAERCVLLRDAYADNAAALGLDPGVDPDSIVPKDD